MTEGEFLRFYKWRNKEKNIKKVKMKIDLFWNVLLKALEEEQKVSLKNWGIFELKEVKARKIMIPKMDKAIFTKAKKTIKFKAGAGLKDIINGAGIDE